MHAFILAGGFATRLWPVTEKRAKPLLPLKGKPIITHLVENIPTSIPVTVSTNAVFEESFRTWKKTLPDRSIEIIVEDAKHDDHKLGALGATAQWITEKTITEDVLLLTGDNYLGFRMEDFLAAYSPGTTLLAAYDIQDLEAAKSFGTIILSPSPAHGGGVRGGGLSTNANGEGVRGGGRITTFEEKPLHPKTTLVSTGCSILPGGVLPAVVAFAKKKPDNIGGVFEELLSQGYVIDCFRFTEPWLDIGSFKAYLDAHRLLVGRNTILDPTAVVTESVCKGSVVLGSGSTIKKSELTDCIIFDNVQITDCILKDCVIDDACVLEGVDLTGKMLRAKTVLRQKQ